MLEKVQIEIITVPSCSFKEKIRITRRFERRYHIDDLAGDAVCGVLYIERKLLNE
ncbi:MAG: flavoprotein [Clostridium sp.]|jgi:uncharacterized protein YlaN (UPF0358 family)|uniref:flavoprotein n=1 Tax=Clostridium sp. TaxID=1506 RepID=UPI0025C62F97|nr:flavoprotein [Clostridium sp.]MCH3965540.1 flavoprotein [Clostridium sp.]MCI1716868.1 flavoprotein [Clostridium sp.]MCI1801202.1 flavoprotein [Clostridium sp.]MCI1815054.1 flavoprotein [Clostridium sp.]MCI1871956.1 flavoprotein [Clostridium sp.]